MRRILGLSIALAIAPALLAGCAGLPASGSAALDGAKGFVAAEAAYDAALQTADAAIDTGQLPQATLKQLKALADAGHAYVLAGREAETAANATDLATETAALTALVAQIAALAKD